MRCYSTTYALVFIDRVKYCIKYKLLCCARIQYSIRVNISTDLFDTIILYLQNKTNGNGVECADRIQFNDILFCMLFECVVYYIIHVLANIHINICTIEKKFYVFFLSVFSHDFVNNSKYITKTEIKPHKRNQILLFIMASEVRKYLHIAISFYTAQFDRRLYFISGHIIICGQCVSYLHF